MTESKVQRKIKEIPIFVLIQYKTQFFKVIDFKNTKKRRKTTKPTEMTYKSTQELQNTGKNHPLL